MTVQTTSSRLDHRVARWLRWRLGAGLSRLGERTGSEWLTYNPLHFYSFHEHAVANAPGVMGAMTTLFPACHSLIDIGAGSGAFAAEGIRLGKHVVAIEYNRAGRRIGRRLGVDIRPFDLTRDPAAVVCEKFDLAYSFEVAEHLPSALGDRLIAFASLQAPIVVFTAAAPGQTGTGHINEQPKPYWIERFEFRGMLYRRDLSQRLSAAFQERRVAPWFAQNLMVFEQKNSSGGDTVKGESSSIEHLPTPKQPLVSVIIGTYNAGEFLRPAVESILDQTHRNLEILIIDDGSTDGCVDSIGDLSDSRIRILRQENRGRPATLNRALDEARGEFYVIQDADDLSAPGRIERLVKCMQENPEVAGVFSGHELIIDDQHMAPRCAPKSIVECRRCIDHFRMPAHDPTGMFRMSMVGDMRYDTSLPYTEAVDYIFRVGERLPLMVLAECLYSYRVHLASITKRDPALREKYVLECFRRACGRRGGDPEAQIRDWYKRTRSKNQLADNNLAAEFIESAVDQRRAGRRLGALLTGLQCSRLHPLDPHYHKAWVLAVTPLFLHRYLRRTAGALQ